MTKKNFNWLKITLWLFAGVLFSLSIYTLLSVNIIGFMDKSMWELIGNVANVLSLLGIAITAFILYPWKLQKVLNDKNLPCDGTQQTEFNHYDAFIFTVSKATLPLWMIKTYQPKAIGLVGSQGSADVCKEIKAYADKKEIPCFSRLLEDPDVVARAKEESQEVINELQAAGYTTIAVDITGGKTPMSIGTFLSAEDNRLDSLYITADYNKKGPITGTIRPIFLSRSTIKPRHS